MKNNKTYKIKDQDYYDENDIQVEVVEKVEVKIEENVSVVSLGNIKKTIEVLKQRKQESIDSFDAEIEENQKLLDTLKGEIKKVKIKERPANPVIEN